MILITTRKILTAMVGVLLIATSTPAADVTFGSGLNQFNMTFVPIDSPGNAGEPGIATPYPYLVGAVGYTYQMGMYEVSEDMINKFNASQVLQITKDTRGTNKPATGVSWFEAARFVNWLNTSQGFAPAYKFTTGGVNDVIALWAPGDAGYNANNLFRNSLANYVLPSIDEWYKAAYYDPTTSTYYEYPTGSDTAPTAVASGTEANTAVYAGSPAVFDRWAGPADITQAGGLSPFGVMGLGGNVREWEETEWDRGNDGGGSNRGVRGGSWNDDSHFLTPSFRSSIGTPSVDNNNIGFRVVSLTPVAVPEPSTWALIGTVTIGLWGWAVKSQRMPC